MSKRVSLRDVASQINYGLTTSATDTKDGPKFLRITDIDKSFIEWESVPHCDATEEQRGKYALQSEDIVVARTGASTGRAQWVQVEAPTVFASYLVRFRISSEYDSRFIGYVLNSRTWKHYVDSVAHGKSAQPNMSASLMADFEFDCPPLSEQRAIAEVLGALDDKIAANSMKASTAEQLAGVLFDKVSVDLNKIPVSQVLTPILGGTPNRKNPEFWGGQVHWASAKDVTSAPHSVVADTEEKITRMATEQTKAKPLPIGGVIVTARGTVGAVARLALPTSFNQSCYGFSPSELPPGLLYFSILRAAQRAKSLSHGSVFDTITMKTFDHLFIPDFGESAEKMEHQIAPLLETVDSSIKENKTLVSMRDALLPQLMSGKLRVRDAESVVEDVL